MTVFERHETRGPYEEVTGRQTYSGHGNTWGVIGVCKKSRVVPGEGRLQTWEQRITAIPTLVSGN